MDLSRILKKIVLRAFPPPDDSSNKLRREGGHFTADRVGGRGGHRGIDYVFVSFRPGGQKRLILIRVGVFDDLEKIFVLRRELLAPFF